MYVRLYVCMYVCITLGYIDQISQCMYVCMYIYTMCTNKCTIWMFQMHMYVCMCVCMYV